MLEDGLSYPFRGEWVGRLIIGGVLSFFSVLLVPVIFVNGYLYRVIAQTVTAGDDTPPEFNQWGELAIKGIGVTVIAVVYAFVPLVLYTFVTSTLAVGASVGGDAGGILGAVSAVTGLLAIPVVIVVYYLIPAAIANYASAGALEAAFDIRAIIDVAFTTEYLVAVLLPIVVAVILWVLTFILLITIIGAILIPFVQFYGQVVVFRMFGVAYREVAGV
ncbi:MAG: DUF4013 domain-containing protein [Salinivenus sp.]